MTAKRDLKKRIRARAAKTGESYTAARAQFRKLRIEEAPSATAEARAEGFACDAVVSKKLRELGDLRPLFARLRELLEALQVPMPAPRRMPSIRDFARTRLFLTSEELGVRGDHAKFAWKGRIVFAQLAPMLMLGLVEEVQLPPLLGIGR